MIHYPILTYVSQFSPLLPIFAGFYRLNIKNRELILLLLYLIIGFIVDIISMWVIKNYWINLGLWHIFVLVEYGFIMSIIYLWQEAQKMKLFFMLLICLYIAFWFYAKLTFEPINGLYSITVSVSQVILTLSAGYTLFVVIGNRVQPLFSNKRFWILLSFVFLYAGTLMPTVLVGMLFKQPREGIFTIWSINWILTIFCNILFTIGFLCPQTQPS